MDVFDPYDVEVPYSNHQSVAAPPGLTVPFSVAEVPATALTVPVIAVGAAADAPCTTVSGSHCCQDDHQLHESVRIYLEPIPLP